MERSPSTNPADIAPPPPTDRGLLLADALAALLIAGAFVMAIRTTSDLTWPPRWDFFRELGSIQAILDGHAGSDPLFRGEARWYNPLIPTVTATASRWFSVSLPTFVARAGPYLNLFVPVGFYFLFRRLLSPWPAVLGLSIFLFWPAPYLPIGTAGVYSPWAWPRNIAQGFYFSGALALALAFERGSWWRVVAGVLIGVTLLAHTAPALMLALAAVLIAASQTIGSAERNTITRSLTTLAIVGVVALVTSAPYTMPLWQAYRFNVANPAPMNTVGLSVPRMILGLLSLRSALACFGVVLLVRGFRQRTGRMTLDRRVLASLWIACLVWLGLGVGYQLLKDIGLELMQVVPEYHFHLYFKSFEAAFAGVGVAALLERLGARFWPGATGAAGRIRAPWAFVAACLLIVAFNWRDYLNSPDLKLFREESLERARQTHLNDFYTWALAHSRSDDVFLADNTYGFFGVGPTGRKVVSIFEFYANPYVALESREKQRRALFDALNRGDTPGFATLARQEGVTYVIDATDAEECCKVRRPLEEPWFTLAFDEGPLKVYRIHPSGSPGSSP